MAQIKTSDIINGNEVNAEIQKVIKALNDLMKELGGLSVQYQKTNGSTKEMNELQKKNADTIKAESKAAKDLESAQKSLAKQRQAGLSVLAKEEAKKREILAASKMEIKTMRDAEKRLSAMKSVYRDLDQSTDAAKESAEKYRLEIQRLDNAVKKGGAGIGEYNRNVGNYPDGMNKAATANKGFGASMSGMIAGITIAIAAIGAVVNKVVTEMVKLGDSRKAIGKLTGETGTSLDIITSKIQAMSDTFDVDFNETMIAANSLAKTMGISVSDALTIMEKGFLGGANASGEFLQTLKEYGAQFKSAGLDAEEFVAIATQNIESGLFSDKGVDTIKEGMLRIREMTKSTSEALDAIGIDSGKMQEDLSNGNLTVFEAIQQVSEKLNELPANSALVGTAIADIFGGAGEDAGLDYIKTLKDIDLNLDNVIDNTNEFVSEEQKLLKANQDLQLQLNATFSASLGGGIDGFKAKIISLASVFLKTVNDTGLLTKYLNMMRERAEMMIKPFKNIWEIFAGTGNETEVLTKLIDGLFWVFDAIIFPVKMVWSFFDMMTGTIKNIVDALRNWKDLEFQDVLDILNEALYTVISPITDMVGLTDELGQLFGIQSDAIKLTAGELDKYSKLLFDYKSIIADVKKTLDDKTAAETKATETAEAAAKAEDKKKQSTEAANDAYKSYLETITKINKEYDTLIQFLKSDADKKDAAISRDQKLFDASLEYYGKVTPEMKKMIDSYKIIVVEAEKLQKLGGLQIANENDIELIKTAAAETENYYQKMLNISAGFDFMATKPKTFFEEITEAAQKFGEFWNKNGEAIQMTIGSIGDAVSQHYDNQISDLERLQDKTDLYYDNLIAKYEGDEAAQAQLEQAKKDAAETTQRAIVEEQRKAAIFSKAQALIDIVINTAVGITKALAGTGNPILAAAIGVTGAIQAGIVASQPLPQYATGLDSAQTDHIGIVSDAGPELVHYPDGSSALFSKPTATFIPKFTSVDTASETRAKLKSLEFQNNMYKFTANNEKQVKLLSTIARNTGKKPNT